MDSFAAHPYDKAMRYIYFLLIFAIGFVVGRWSIDDKDSVKPKVTLPESSSFDCQNRPAIAIEKKIAPFEDKTPIDESKSSQTSNLVRTDDKARDKQIRQLFSKLVEANGKDQTEEQNKLFREMESLSPRHETVFQARAMFLQDDEDWQGAHAVLKECVSVIPDSIYCLRRLANIRSSTNEEKLRYASECLQASKNDPLCLVDLAMALHTQGDFAKAKEYFEQALNLPKGSEGYNKEYLLYQYARTLESLGLYPKAKAAFTEACRLNMKSACDALRAMGS